MVDLYLALTVLMYLTFRAMRAAYWAGQPIYLFLILLNGVGIAVTLLLGAAQFTLALALVMAMLTTRVAIATQRIIQAN
jgi:hypothetical protein